MEFLVEIVETLPKTIMIQAETGEEALRIVEKQFHNERRVLDSSDFKGVNFSAAKAED